MSATSNKPSFASSGDGYRKPHLSVVEPPQSGALEEPDPAPEAEKHTKSILIVEDEEGIRSLLEEVLSIEGYAATSVGNGDEGISVFREHPYDLVFTDLRMPGISGSEVARAIKSHSASTPVVVLTGWDTEPLEPDLVDVGVDRILQKPFQVDDVLDLVLELTS